MNLAMAIAAASVAGFILGFLCCAVSNRAGKAIAKVEYELKYNARAIADADYYAGFLHAIASLKSKL